MIKIRDLNLGRLTVLCAAILIAAVVALLALESAVGSGMQPVLHSCGPDSKGEPLTYEWDPRLAVDALKVWGRTAVMMATPTIILWILWVWFGRSSEDAHQN